jgi:Zn-dependent peptidase ImmA (M78 family)/DNA-binding XRE family transcriptional regulator
VREKEVDVAIGARIRDAREKAGLSQHDLAQRLGYSSPATVSNMEAGERRITVADLSAVSETLGIPLDRFLPVGPNASARQFSLRASTDLHNINPATRRSVLDFLTFAERHGQQCAPPPSGLRRKRPGPAAETILELTNIHEPPVSPRDVARHLSIPVFDWSLGDEISGIFVCFDGRTAIGVNEGHPPVRQRFTVAHELGHFVYADRDAIVFDYLGRERGFSFEMSESPDSETMANQFAADLLMPSAWVRDDFSKHGLDLALLRRKYVVSEQAMWFRLLNLRLVEENDRDS